MEEKNKWKEELDLLKSIVAKSGMTETIKWGISVYTHKGVNVVGIAGFKSYFNLWFYHGVFLKDEENVLVNAQEGKTKALRQWRFASMEEIDENMILAYVRECIRNVEDGKVWKPQKSKPMKIPEIMTKAFEATKGLEAAFSKLTPYKQKEYLEYIDAAKREATKISRMEKIKPLILQGSGLHDKYK